MKSVLRWIVIGAILAALVLGYYWYLSNLDHSNDNESSKETKVEEVDRILNKDLDAAYPETPRGVVKWYNRIITEYYAGEHSDSEITGLANQTRKLLDEELLEKNPEDAYLASVKADIASWNDRKAKIVTTEVCSSNNVRYETVNGYECAYVTAYYCTKENVDIVQSYQEFCLRKDKDGKWKILTWRLTTGDESDYI